MNVADKDLCQELYELSGWHTEDNYDWYHGIQEPFAGKGTGYNFMCPAYDLGYLLRKLPKFVNDGEYRYGLGLSVDVNDWWAEYLFMDDMDMEPKYIALANTPENAACRLLIALVKEKVINVEK